MCPVYPYLLTKSIYAFIHVSPLPLKFLGNAFIPTHTFCPTVSCLIPFCLAKILPHQCVLSSFIWGQWHLHLNVFHASHVVAHPPLPPSSSFLIFYFLFHTSHTFPLASSQHSVPHHPLPLALATPSADTATIAAGISSPSRKWFGKNVASECSFPSPQGFRLRVYFHRLE